jgi:hypothetical protein
MPKYLNKPAIAPAQEKELYPLMDAALQLPFGKAIIYDCTITRSNYLRRVALGEQYRNAIASISTYTPEDPLYGKGLYYTLVIESHPKGLIIANIQNPPGNLTWDIIKCAASRKPVPITYSLITTTSRLNKLKDRHPNEIGSIYIDQTSSPPVLRYAVPNQEEIFIVDIDIKGEVRTPTPVDRAKIRQ